MMHVSSMEVTCFSTLSSEMFYLPVLAPSAGIHTIGYQNTRPTGFMDYVMIIAAFAP